MPKLEKLLKKFDLKQRKELEIIIKRIISLNWRDLDIKKLKGYGDIFRVRKGNLRIIFSRSKEDIYILSIERRSDKTYNF